MKKTQKTNSYYVPTSIQKLFLFPVIALFMAQTLFITYGTIDQLRQGTDYRPQLGYLMISNLLPVLIFALAYVMNPRKLKHLSKSFEALLITVSGLMVWSVLNMLIPVLFLFSAGTYDMKNYEYISATVFVLLYTLVLLLLRKKGIWA